MNSSSLDLLGEPAAGATPETQGIKYAGSKLKILPYIVDLIRREVSVRTVLDGFSGSTRVSQALSQLGYRVTANDVSVWSECFGQCFLQSEKDDRYYQQIIDHLNALQGYDGWFTQNYGGTPAECKRPFQVKNTRRLDVVRDEIDRLGLCRIDRSVILTSLVLALDAVDSTMGHYVSYLNRWSARSYNDMILKLPRRYGTREGNRVVRGDIFDTIQEDTVYDLAYFDPPYGSNNEKMPPSRVRYASYYHIWTSVILNDRPQLFGKAARREDTRDAVSGSVFEQFRRNEQGEFMAMEALDRLIEQTRARYIMLSYSSGGRATKDELMGIIERRGRLLKAVDIDHRRNVMSSMNWTQQWVNSEGKYHEYLLLMEK